MNCGVPMLNPKFHLKGATPEKLARALFRRTAPPQRPARVREAVAGGEVAVEKVPADETATVSRIWQSVSDSLILCLLANSLIYRCRCFGLIF